MFRGFAETFLALSLLCLQKPRGLTSGSNLCPPLVLLKTSSETSFDRLDLSGFSWLPVPWSQEFFRWVDKKVKPHICLEERNLFWRNSPKRVFFFYLPNRTFFVCPLDFRGNLSHRFCSRLKQMEEPNPNTSVLDLGQDVKTEKQKCGEIRRSSSTWWSAAGALLCAPVCYF